MSEYRPEQHDKPPRFDIHASDVDEVDRPYLNYLQAAREPVDLGFWAFFSKIEIEFLIDLIEKYKIPIIKGDPDKKIPDLVTPINILNTTSQKVNKEIADVYLPIWKDFKKRLHENNPKE